ncbi:YadA-like family protein [Microvirga zambiensis]|uniref:YadA-like family protein n=1 Tax=Microvirga zambiensis TaxID=1402137 RepID=UPI00191F95C1|nr:YadA-like family protein [Microvirga zambiensis]
MKSFYIRARTAAVGLAALGLVAPNAAYAAPTVTGTQGCVIKPGATTYTPASGGTSGEDAGNTTNAPIGCAGAQGSSLTTQGNFADTNSVNNAITNLQNQINNINGQMNEDTPVVSDGSTIQGNGTAGSPLRLNPAITNQINNHEVRLGGVEAVNNAQTTRLDNVEARNATQDTRLTNTETKNTAQDTRLDAVEQRNVIQDDRIDAIESVNGTQNQTLANHETRIGGLETTVASHGTRLDAAETVLADHSSQLSNHTSQLTDHATQLADHGSRLGTVETKVAGLTVTVDQHSTWINNVNAGKGITNFRTNSNGPDAQATGDKTVSVGAGSVASHTNSVALGDGSTTDRENSVSVGTAGGERQITNVAAGTENTDAANVAQLRALAAALGGGAAVGAGSNGQTINGRSSGAAEGGSASDGGAVLMPTYKVQDREYRNVGGAIAALDDSTIKYNRNEDGSKSNRITLSGGDKRKPVQISNVADGVKDFDAVNVGQLKAAAGGGKTYTDTRIDVMKEYVDRRFSALSGEIGEVRKEARAAAAVGLATASLRYDPRPGKVSFAGGAGHWRGSTGMAMGVGWNSEDGVARYNISASTADGGWGVAGGMSFTLN